MGRSDSYYDGGSVRRGRVDMTCPDCDERWEAWAYLIAAGGCEVFEDDEACPECGKDGDVGGEV